MDKWAGKVAVVTGASSGIGAAISVKLAKSGMTVIGLARRVEQIQDLSKQVPDGKGSIHGMKFDVREVESIPSLFETIKKTYGGVDVMINNAGVMHSATKVYESSTQDFKDILDTNLLSMAVFCRESVKSMRERDFAGHILNLNSVAGHRVYTNEHFNFNLYTASKYGVTAFTETLRIELALLRKMIRVTSISPGLVQTEIFDKASMSVMNENQLDNYPHLKPEEIADCVILALSLPQSVVITELTVRHSNDSI